MNSESNATTKYMATILVSLLFLMRCNIAFCLNLRVNYTTVASFLNIAVGRRFAEEQPRESELQGGSVAIDHLCGDVQKDAVSLFIRVV